MEIGLSYTVKAKCEIDDLCEKEGVADIVALYAKLGAEKADVYVAKIMHSAYCDRNKDAKRLPDDCFWNLTIAEFKELDDKIFDVMNKDSGITVETEPPKKTKKTAKSD